MILSGIRGKSGKSGKKWAPFFFPLNFKKMLLITDLKKKKRLKQLQMQKQTLNAKQNEA